MIVCARVFAVLLVLELEFFFILFRILFEEGIPLVDLVERLVYIVNPASSDNRYGHIP